MFVPVQVSIWDAKAAVDTVTSDPFILPPLKEIELHDNTFKVGVITVVTLILVCILLCPIARCCYKYCYRRHAPRARNSKRKAPVFHITLDVGDELTRISLNLIEVPFTPEHYNIRATNSPADVRVTGGCRPKLHINWPELTVDHKNIPLRYTVPDHINLSMREAYRLRRLLQRPHYMLSHILSETGQMDLIPIVPPELHAQEPAEQHMHPPPSVAVLHLLPRIHASLHDISRQLGPAFTSTCTRPRGRSPSTPRRLSGDIRRMSTSLYPTLPTAPFDIVRPAKEGLQ
jgi:hypothetical protein